MLEKRQEADVRELNKALNDFRLMHQQPDGRREWDLYDPDAKRKDKPARVHDDDPRLTISGKREIISVNCLFVCRQSSAVSVPSSAPDF